VKFFGELLVLLKQSRSMR